MKPVTDPQLLAQLNGNVTVSAGRKGQTAAEGKDAGQQLQFQQQGRMVLRGLAQAEGFNQQIAPGRFKAGLAIGNKEPGGVSSLPSGWQEGFDVPLFQMFDGVTNRLVRPAAAALAGRNLGVSETNQPSELEAIKTMLPNPRLEREANTFATNAVSREVMERLAREKALDKWRSRYGSQQTPNEKGQTFQEVWSLALNSGTPEFEALRNFDFAGTMKRNLQRQQAVPGQVPGGAPARAPVAPAAQKVLRYNPATGELE